MKKQWLSMILVLCMVLCLAPATAQAEESKTCKVIITVEVNGRLRASARRHDLYIPNQEGHKCSDSTILCL